MNITIKITDEEAEHLSHSTSGCFYHEQADRFDCVNKDDETNNIMDTFDSSHTMHFFDDNIINPILFKNYMIAKGVRCVILWDEGQMCYAIVTDQNWDEYLKGNKYVTKSIDNDEPTNNEYVDVNCVNGVNEVNDVNDVSIEINI